MALIKSSSSLKKAFFGLESAGMEPRNPESCEWYMVRSTIFTIVGLGLDDLKSQVPEPYLIARGDGIQDSSCAVGLVDV